jgi:hypothetical protein
MTGTDRWGKSAFLGPPDPPIVATVTGTPLPAPATRPFFVFPEWKLDNLRLNDFHKYPSLDGFCIYAFFRI